jgi:SAM-dependent methyltransferase
LNLRFEIAYLLGFAPWDRWHGKLWEPLRNLIEGPEALLPGRAIDLGCGMGRLTIYLAQQGWQATGVDAVEGALRVARTRAAKAEVDVKFVHGDVMRLDQSGIVGPFELLLDFGCFHTMSQDQRRHYVKSITGVAAQNAELLLFALEPRGFFRLWPRGARRADIERHFSRSWNVTWSASEEKMPEKLPPGAAATWYRLKRKVRMGLGVPEAHS